MRERCITVVGSNEQELVSKGLRHISVSELPIEKVKSSLSQFVSDIESIFDGLEEKIEHYNLDEIELRIALSTSGSISLIGAVETGIEGGISLKFKRCNHE